MSKLLNKPLKAFAIYALIILGCSIPVYYLVVDFIWLKELDEHNQIIKQRIEQGVSDIHLEKNELDQLLANWSKLQPATSLTPSSLFIKPADSVYTVIRNINYSSQKGIDRFRGLSAYININGKLYHLQVETNVEETDETMLAITIVTFLFFVLLVVGFIILNKRIAKKIWQPFSNTLEKLKSFDLTTQQSVSFSNTDIAEFTELNQSLQKLIEKNVSAYSQQKIFIENASHELQTPLAVLKSKLNLLLQNKDITSEQSHIISAIELPLSKITRINKNLLLLAKIENNQFAEKEATELTALVKETHGLLADYIAAKQLEVKMTFAVKMVIECNKTLLEFLVNNLFINAIVHNKKGGEIIVVISAKKLTISNTGISPLNNEKLFKRFAVSSAESTSSGLGLAIVKEICIRYGWHVSYSFANGLHSFSIMF
ncbi:MAG: sensor histidine kinase [Lacibacter sp.]